MLLTAVLILFVLTGVLAPLGSYGWWAGWYGDKLPDKPQRPEPQESPAKIYVVYLTGIGGFSPDTYPPMETEFLKRLAVALPEAEIVDDVFPYSNDNRALTGQRVFGAVWGLLESFKGRRLVGPLSFLINIRNLWQVLVSSDDRFGPLYNYASAELVLRKLTEHGYVRGSSTPVTFIGYSGGGQVSLGTAPFIREAIGAPVHLISLAGVMSGEGGVLTLSSLTHLYGDHDLTQRLGYVVFPKRWPLFSATAWNRARRRGLIDKVDLGAMGHTGRGSYLDPDAVLEGESHLERTLAHMVRLIRQQVS